MTKEQHIILKEFLNINNFYCFKPKLNISTNKETVMGMKTMTITVSDYNNTSTTRPIQYKITFTYSDPDISDTYDIYIYNIIF